MGQSLATVLLLSLIVDARGSVSDVQLVNNGYDNVVVAIGNDIAKNDSLLTTIKDAFSAASRALFQATGQRAFFRQVTIVIPPSWTGSNSYGSASLEESFRSAQFRIASTPVERLTRARMQSFGFGCGREGRYVQLPPERLWIGKGSVSDRHCVDNMTCTGVQQTGSHAGTHARRQTDELADRY